VRFSLPLLYEALVYQYTQLLQDELHGHRRAFRAENYIDYLLTQFIQDHFPSEKAKVFKLVILNKDPQHRGRAWANLQQYLPEFRYDRQQIQLSEDQLGTRFTFLEFDLLFLFKGNLVVVDVKDDLFWEAKDLPAPVILWGRHQQAKISNQVVYLQNPFVQAALAKEGIQYSRTESLVVAQGHINCGDFRYIGDLFDALQKLHWGEEFGASINAPRFSPYP